MLAVKLVKGAQLKIIPGAPHGLCAKREQAAQLVADDNLTDDEICAKVGVSNRQLDRWKAIPEFKARGHEHVAAWKARIMERGIAIKAVSVKWCPKTTRESRPSRC